MIVFLSPPPVRYVLEEETLIGKNTLQIAHDEKYVRFDEWDILCSYGTRYKFINDVQQY